MTHPVDLSDLGILCGYIDSQNTFTVLDSQVRWWRRTNVAPRLRWGARRDRILLGQPLNLCIITWFITGNEANWSSLWQFHILFGNYERPLRPDVTTAHPLPGSFTGKYSHHPPGSATETWPARSMHSAHLPSPPQSLLYIVRCGHWPGARGCPTMPRRSCPEPRSVCHGCRPGGWSL